MKAGPKVWGGVKGGGPVEPTSNVNRGERSSNRMQLKTNLVKRW